MIKRWRFSPHDAGRIRDFERAAGVSPVVAQLLLARGVADPATAKTFLEARMSGLRDPELLPGLPQAVECIHRAIQDQRRITIYGDYDADGMTAAAILVRCLRMLNAKVDYYVPNRLDEGYGLHDDALRELASRGSSLVISVDCGVSSVQQAETAAELGLELVITDHHQLAPQLPRAAAVVHPRLPGSNYPFSGLCGAGVAFKLAWALCQQASGARKVAAPLREFLLTALGLAAIGTVADVVPLVDENRLLVRHGLLSLKNRPPAGVAELMRVAGLTDKPSLASEDIAFALAPRLNAAGRLGQAMLGVELLETDSRERAAALADYLHELNRNRETLERSVYLSARKQLKEQFDERGDPAFVLDGAGWHPGVIGIVAGRLADKLNAPVVLIARDQAVAKPAVGSARSACGLNLFQAIGSCQERLLRFGGHAAAAGLTIRDQDIVGFREAFCEWAAGEIAAEARIPEVRIDAEAPFSELNYQTVRMIESLAPFGEGNRRPVLCATGVELAGPPKLIGESQRHVSVRLRQHSVGFRAIAFGQAEWAQEWEQHPERLMDVAFQPGINHFRGFDRIELQLIDWRPSESAR